VLHSGPEGQDDRTTPLPWLKGFWLPPTPLTSFSPFVVSLVTHRSFCCCVLFYCPCAYYSSVKGWCPLLVSFFLITSVSRSNDDFNETHTAISSRTQQTRVPSTLQIYRSTKQCLIEIGITNTANHDPGPFDGAITATSPRLQLSQSRFRPYTPAADQNGRIP
jgi:hypothetical protein